MKQEPILLEQIFLENPTQTRLVGEFLECDVIMHKTCIYDE